MKHISLGPNKWVILVLVILEATWETFDYFVRDKKPSMLWVLLFLAFLFCVWVDGYVSDHGRRIEELESRIEELEEKTSDLD